MTTSPSSSDSQSLQVEISELLNHLPNMKHGELIQRALTTLVRMAEVEADRLDWKILNSSLQDMEQAFRVFYPYRHIRKISIFGSARTKPDAPEYRMAADFARCVAQMGFMVMTGGGPGIMQAGNEGAGLEKSFGLNIQLPFEQGSNPFIEGDLKLINFKYFFTRKLFFLRESDALALFPGGFGTQDEAFECLTLMQTGKADPLPLVLVDPPGGDYWKNWEIYQRDHLLKAGWINEDDLHLYTLTDRVDEACEAIASFYKVFHSSRYVGENLILLLKCEPSEEIIDYLNQKYSKLLVKGQILRGTVLPQEVGSETEHLSRLILHFNQRDLGLLYQLIRDLNRLVEPAPEVIHPEQK
jgi:uncharacterized protein (TIGR00730 family)